MIANNISILNIFTTIIIVNFSPIPCLGFSEKGTTFISRIRQTLQSQQLKASQV